MFIYHLPYQVVSSRKASRPTFISLVDVLVEEIHGKDHII